MKTKIKRHSRSVISVLLAVCMIFSCMTAAMIATDAAKTEGETVGANADSEAVGYSNCKVKGTWDNWTLHDITSTAYSVNLKANSTYSFVYVAENNDQFSSSATISGSTDYNFSVNYNDAITLKTTVAGSYKFSFKSWGSSGNSITVRIEFPANTETTTWTAVGAYGTGTNPDAGFFGTAWAPTATANDMTKSGTTWSKTWNNVTLSAQKTIYYKVAKNHSWDTAYPAQNAEKLLAAGTYNITITYDESNNAVDLTYTSVAKSRLTVGSVANATVTATYNGTTKGEGEYFDNVPEGATITVKVTPDSRYKCTAVSPSGTASGTNWIVTMPGSDTTINATISPVTTKKIYFNNSYTLYGSVYAYVYDKDDNTKTYEYLGARPGTTMTKLDNSNIWYIEVPEDVDYVEFISGEGYSTGEMSIPWNDQTYPKYTAPYGHNNAPTETNGGTWGNYIYGSDNKRTNEYTVSDGSTMSASNLFTGITATMYDYYTNGEIAAFAGTDSDTGASGAPNGWLKGIASNEYDPGTSGNLWLPYEDLNGALIGYADNTHQPTYDITYPLYFGNLNYVAGANEVSGYFNYSQKANNSVPLTYSSNAVTGLSGKTLANGSIHYYDADDTTNENGAPMAMFNEDFLSGENSEGKPLATILRTSSFPVRKTTFAAGYHKIYFDASELDWWNNDKVTTKAHFWDSNHTSDTLDVVMTQDQTNKFIYSTDRVDSKYDKVIFYRGNWNNETATLSVPIATDSGLCYKLDGTGDNKGYGGSWTTNSDAVYYNASHDYYEFDSTNGKDNAYITDINKSDKTAKINYYYDSYKTKTGAGAGDPYGFFPFDYNTYQNNANNSSNIAHDLGFGMKLEIPFTLEANGKFSNNDPQEFNFSGDDDLWVFVDGKLVLDLGGAHGRTTGTINFNTKKITYTMTESIGSATRNDDFTWFDNTNPNYVHTMTIYYMERGMFDSNLKFGFSFHAIPNQFWIDKKIRTKDIINAGFYVYNEQTGDASNKDATLTTQEGRFISKFEASYQNENFTVAHKVGDTQNGTFSPAANLEYTIDNDTTTHNTGSEGTYPIKHDLGNAFIGKFTTGKYFNLTETFGNNKYVYTPAFSVWDQANNNQAITASGDNTSGYTFHFNPTTTVTTGIENTNIKARFENYMVAHSLTLTKELTNTVDPAATFTLQVLFDFEHDDNYIAYPLYCDVDGVRTKLSNTGTITIKAGQIVEIEEIPQNAKIKVQEVLTDEIDGYRYDGITLTQAGATMTPDYTPTDGKYVVFTMHSSDIVATVKNKKPDYSYILKYTYPAYVPSYGNQSYTVKGVFTDNEKKTYLELDNNNQPAFQSTELKKIFVNNKAPYEDNFQQTLSFANSNIVDSGTGKGWNDGIYTCEVTATSSNNNKINVYFNLPYAVDSDTLVPQESDSTGKVAKVAPAAKGAKEIDCFDWYVTSGKSREDKSGNTPVFVKAPLILYTNVNDDNTAQYFQYWSVTTKASYGRPSVEYTRCYDYEFNFALFMDCVITPMYASTWAQASGNPHPPTAYDMYSRYDAELQINSDNEKAVKIAFLENSRNQFNSGDKGKRDGNPAADLVYSDFLLNFNYIAGTQQLRLLPADTKKAGLVVEAVDYMKYEENTTFFDFDKDYSSDTDYTSNAATQAAAITSWLTNGGDKPTGVAKSEFDVRDLDNKNCIQYYYSLNNRKYSENDTAELLNTLQNRYKVFRAYAYIGDVVPNDDTKLSNVTLSAPVYFTIYDAGSQQTDDNVIRP